MKQKNQSTSAEKFQISRTHQFQPCFQTNSSIFSRIFFLWSHKLIKKGNQKPLQMQDLSDLRQNQQPIYSAQRFQKIFESFSYYQPTRLLKSFKKYIGINFIIAGILATFSNLLQFAGPIAVSKVLQFLHSGGKDLSQGILYISLLIISYLVRTVIYQHSMHFVNLNGIQALNSTNSLIYKKIIKLSSASRKHLQTGTIMNNVNVDTVAFYFFLMMSTFLFSAPIMITVAIVMLVIEVGWIGLTAPLLFFMGMGIQQKLMKKGFQMRKDQLFWSDKRSKCVNQYFSGIRIIKYYGWQKLVQNKIQNIRQQQLKLNFKVLIIRTYVQVLMNMLPIFSSIIIFGVYVAMYGQQQLSTAKAYTVLSIFNLIAVPMRLVVMALINYMNAKASLQRVQHFLGYQEKNMEGINVNDQSLQIGEIQLNQCKFNWETQQAKQHFEKGKKLFEKSKLQQKNKQLNTNMSIASSSQQSKIKKQQTKKKKQLKNSASQGKKKKKKKKLKKPSLLTQQNLNQSLLPSQQIIQSIQQRKYALEIDSLKIKKGQFVSVIGRVGCGKSTLLSAILNEIDKVQGKASRRGKIAYIPQISWLRSATIRQNILFQQQYNQQRYKQILQICQLNQDLSILGGGDLTQIGQKGVNLSGGQKQRVSIARAIYTNADIYLIDDCLSSLDPYLGKNIFFNVLQKYLHNNHKTIVFVTNAIDYTQYTDRVLVIQNGKIIQNGSPRQLLKQPNSAFNKLKLKFKQTQQKESEQKQKNQQKIALIKKKTYQLFTQQQQKKYVQQKQNIKNSQKKKQLQGLVKVEQRLKGSVPWKFYYRFFTGPGQIATFLMFFFILLAQAARVGSDWWLGQWSNHGFGLHQGTYIWIYSIISFVVGALLYLKGIFFAKFIISISQIIQRLLIKKLLKSPLAWFDITPTGRILARTSKDQDDLDSNLSFNVQMATQNLFILIASVLLISIATPLYLIVAFICIIVYYQLIKMYMNSSRQLKRLQAITRAPLISHFQQTVTGIYVIRAFQKNQYFYNKYLTRQKHYIISLVNQNITTRWINLMTDLFSVLTIASAGYLGVFSAINNMGPAGSNLIGLALVWSLQINAVLGFTLRVMADTQSNMNAVVRLYDYIDNNPSQKEFDQPQPSQNPWPNHGVYSIKQISYRYRPQLPLVIKKISFDIKQNAKIGIVGRTGSGKSTMTLGLLRILQIALNDDDTKGTIQLDNQNVSQIGLHFLRHNIAIIPQDPVLFTGTIKSNIDPLNIYQDQQIAQCLKKVQLWNHLRQNEQQHTEIRKKLYGTVDQSGNNFSLGQRQLICMARALIRKPKALLMDQATASIDQKTDQTIQNMIRKQFNNVLISLPQTTVITIAHRLNTIIQYDKILVLNFGQIQQYDTPLSLVKNQNSFLGKSIRKIGQQYLQKMISLASQKYQSTN